MFVTDPQNDFLSETSPVWALVVVAELEHAHDVRVDQADAGLPFPVESGRGNAIAGQYLERDRGARQPIVCEPGFGRAPGSELADQRVTIRKLKSCFQVLH